MKKVDQIKSSTVHIKTYKFGSVNENNLMKMAHSVQLFLSKKFTQLQKERCVEFKNFYLVITNVIENEKEQDRWWIQSMP